MYSALEQNEAPPPCRVNQQGIEIRIYVLAKRLAGHPDYLFDRPSLQMGGGKGNQ